VTPRCVHGDARRPGVLAEALAGRRTTLLLTDPPYCLLSRRRRGGEDREPRRGRKIDREPVLRFDDVRAYRRFTAEWLPAAAASVVDPGTVVVWTNFLGRAPILSVAADAGFPILAPGEPSLPWAVVAGYDEEGDAERWGSHPNHKPFGVLEPLLRTWSRPGDLVLDCFAGSGSIPAAALRLGREVACIELEATWADRVSTRIGEVLSVPDPGAGA
jgi:site-specific DNA-methyltransferase (adenine-specific)